MWKYVFGCSLFALMSLPMFVASPRPAVEAEPVATQLKCPRAMAPQQRKAQAPEGRMPEAPLDWRGLNAFSQTILGQLKQLPGQDEKKEEAPKVPEVIYSPYDCVKVALDDIRGVIALGDPELDPIHIRYLALYNYPPEKRVKLKKALDFVINSLNTKYRQIIRTAVLPATGTDPLVIRVNLKDYGIDPKAWDNLAEKGSGRVPLPDPYFHTRVESIVDTKAEYKTTTRKEKRERWVDIGHGRRQLVYEEVDVEDKKLVKPAQKGKKVILATAPWLAVFDKGEAVAELIASTQTKNPILRGDWFLAYATQPPAYYELIGIQGKVEVVDGVAKILKGQREYEKLVLLDKALAGRSRIAGIADSKIVTLNNRILTRFATVAGYTGGYVWVSSDTKKGIDGADYLNSLAKFETPEIDAQEYIGTALNTLQIYSITDNAENLVLFADPQVAIHGDTIPTRLQDKLIYGGIRNCALCHGEGIIKINDKVRSIAQRKIALFISNVLTEEDKQDKDLARRIRDAFAPDLVGVIRHDNAIHAAAILACNDLKPLDNKNNMEDFLVVYLDAFISPEVAAREAGWPRDQLLAALKRAVNLDHTVVSLLQDPPVDVSRLPWERQGYAVLMNYLLTQPQPKHHKR